MYACVFLCLMNKNNIKNLHSRQKTKSYHKILLYLRFSFFVGNSEITRDSPFQDLKSYDGLYIPPIPCVYCLLFMLLYRIFTKIIDLWFSPNRGTLCYFTSLGTSVKLVLRNPWQSKVPLIPCKVAVNNYNDTGLPTKDETVNTNYNSLNITIQWCFYFEYSIFMSLTLIGQR